MCGCTAQLEECVAFRTDGRVISFGWLGLGRSLINPSGRDPVFRISGQNSDDPQR